MNIKPTFHLSYLASWAWDFFFIKQLSVNQLDPQLQATLIISSVGLEIIINNACTIICINTVLLHKYASNELFSIELHTEELEMAPSLVRLQMPAINLLTMVSLCAYNFCFYTESEMTLQNEYRSRQWYHGCGSQKVLSGPWPMMYVSRPEPESHRSCVGVPWSRSITAIKCLLIPGRNTVLSWILRHRQLA